MAKQNTQKRDWMVRLIRERHDDKHDIITFRDDSEAQTTLHEFEGAGDW